MLESFFPTDEGIRQEQAWNEGRREAVEGMVSLVKNYPPTRGAYTPSEVRTLVQIAGFQQIQMLAPDFVRSLSEREEALDIDAFPSIKASTLTVFYKFYVDRSRRPQVSDAFDVLIASAIPYMDAVITENHQAQAIRKMQRRDRFLESLRVFTLRDFRRSPPVNGLSRDAGRKDTLGLPCPRTGEPQAPPARGPVTRWFPTGPRGAVTGP